jgi:hypothetical protein
LVDISGDMHTVIRMTVNDNPGGSGNEPTAYWLP